MVAHVSYCWTLIWGNQIQTTSWFIHAPGCETECIFLEFYDSLFATFWLFPLTTGQGRLHGVDWSGRVHPIFARGRSWDWCKSCEFSWGWGYGGVRIRFQFTPWQSSAEGTVHCPSHLIFWQLNISNGSKVVTEAHRAPTTLRRVTRITEIRWERTQYREWKPTKDSEVATFASRLCVPMTKPFSFAPWPPDFVTGSRCALAIVVHPTFLHLATPLQPGRGKGKDWQAGSNTWLCLAMLVGLTERRDSESVVAGWSRIVCVSGSAAARLSFLWWSPRRQKRSTNSRSSPTATVILRLHDICNRLANRLYRVHGV